MPRTCDHSAAQVVDSQGGTTEGRFKEKYECPCGATGYVSGNAEEPPQQWNRWGRVFDDE